MKRNYLLIVGDASLLSHRCYVRRHLVFGVAVSLNKRRGLVNLLASGMMAFSYDLEFDQFRQDMLKPSYLRTQVINS